MHLNLLPNVGYGDLWVCYLFLKDCEVLSPPFGMTALLISYGLALLAVLFRTLLVDGRCFDLL
jgi:hypothetical protein